MIYPLTGIHFDTQHAYIPSQWAICISSAPQGLLASYDPLGYPLRGPGMLNTKICIHCVLMIYAFTGINFDIQHAYIPSIGKFAFLGPLWALTIPYDTPLRGPRLPLNKKCVYTVSQ